MKTRVMIAVLVFGLGKAAGAAEPTPPPSLAAFSKGLCDSYVELTAKQRAKALKPALQAVFGGLQAGRTAAIRCGVRVVEDLRAGVVAQCLIDPFEESIGTDWRASVDVGLEICQPGAVAPPEEEAPPAPPAGLRVQ